MNKIEREKMNFFRIKWLYFFLLVSTNLLVLEEYGFDDNYIYVDFDQSMNTGSKLYLNKYQNKQFKSNFIEKLKELYEKNNLLHIRANGELKIPKIMHQIWVGPNPLPKFYKKLAHSWKKKHPDWEYKLWTDKDVVQINLINQKMYDEAKSYSEKANVLRYEILQQFGGVYVDIDFECIKPLDPLHYCYDFYTGVTPNDANAVLSNGIVGSVPQHKFINMLIHQMHTHEKHNSQFHRNGVEYFSKIFNEYLYHKVDTVDIVLPLTYFFPLYKNIKNNQKKIIMPESFGIHYWGHDLVSKIAMHDKVKYN